MIDYSIFTFDGNGVGIVDLTTTLQCVQGNNPRSISFMIQSTAISGCNIILSTGSLSATNAFDVAFNCDGSDGLIEVHSLFANYHPTTGKAINDGLWHTVLVTYDGGVLSIYVDGRLDNTATNWNGGGTTDAIASTLNTVGNDNYLGQIQDGGYRFLGQLKNVKFYDYALSNLYALANSYQSAGSIILTSDNLDIVYISIYLYML